jgi:group I intron endonuclease
MKNAWLSWIKIVYMNKCGVYMIRCEPTGSRYVGASVNVVKRIREHFYRLEKGTHRNRRLQSAFNKYGKESFSSKVLLYCDPNNVEWYGEKIIKMLKPEFNIVHNIHTKVNINKTIRALDDYFKRQDKFFRGLERTLNRTHRC